MLPVIPMNSTQGLPKPKLAVATYIGGFMNYMQHLHDDKPMEAGAAAYALGLTWKHDPYNTKGAKKEDRDGPRSSRWVLGWNNAKAQAEGGQVVTGPGIDSPAALTPSGELLPPVAAG